MVNLQQEVFTFGQVGPSYSPVRAERLAEDPLVLERHIAYSTVVDATELCEMIRRDERLFQLG